MYRRGFPFLVLVVLATLLMAVIWWIDSRQRSPQETGVIERLEERQAAWPGERPVIKAAYPSEVASAEERAAIEIICAEGGTVYDGDYGMSICFGPLLPSVPSSITLRAFEPKEKRMWAQWNSDNTNPIRTTEALKTLVRLRRVGYIDLFRYPLSSEQLHRLRVALPDTRIAHASEYAKARG